MRTSLTSLIATIDVLVVAVAFLLLIPLSVNAETTTFDVSAKKWEFTPSIITVTEGDLVTLNITSVDVDHGFALSEFGVNEVLVAGTTTPVVFTAETAGTYSFFCNVFCGSGHESMTGTLIVEATVVEEVISDVVEAPVGERDDAVTSMASGFGVSELTASTATIVWNSTLKEVGQVEYGTTPGVYSEVTPLEEIASKKHSAVLTGLSEGTTYYYRIKTQDVEEDVPYSDEMTFTTTSTEDVSAEEEIEEPLLISDMDEDAGEDVGDIRVIEAPVDRVDEAVTSDVAEVDAEIMELESENTVVATPITAETAPQEKESRGAGIVVIIVLLGAIILTGASYMLFRQVHN